MLINKRTFKRLSPESRQAVLDAAQKAEQSAWDLVVEREAKDTATLSSNGIKVAKPSSQLLSELKKVGQVMTEEWQQEAPKEVKAVLAKYQ